MGNYLILNEVNSNTITGLLIQNLPPISKPRQRVNIEEIDGRDGDLITPLGYGAYDKEFLIGLSYNYDINEIIKYFDSEGTVTFSNEPDKYYNYKIIEQIDYEKLIRFKTATVKMHVQPFKYANNEEPIEQEYHSQTTEGKSITLNNTVPNIFNEFSIHGNTEQNGNQTPDNPVALKNAGDNGIITEIISNEDGTETQEISIPCQQPMRSIGDVKDEFVKVNGVWYERHHIKKVIIDGYHTGWSRDSTRQCFACSEITSFLPDIKLPIDKYTLPEIKCSHFIPDIFNNVWAGLNPTDNSIAISSDGTNNPRIRMTSITTVQDFLTWLQNNDVEIIYVLNTPVDLVCTQEQIDVLEANKYSYDGQTNINSEDETPAHVRAEFNDNTIVNVTNEGNIYSKPIFTIEGSGDIGVVLNNTQIFEISLGEEEYITIDIERMEAYKGTTLKNRLVKGNYDNFLLQVGTNAISFTGAITRFEISKYSRWI